MMAWLMFVCIFLLGEVVYHLFDYGLVAMNSLYVLGLIVVWSFILILFTSLFRGVIQKIIYLVLQYLIVIWYGAQTVYTFIFKQPLLWEAIFYAGADALADFYEETLAGILKCLPMIVLLLAFLITLTILVCKNVIKLPSIKKFPWIWTGVSFVVGLALTIGVMQVGRIQKADYYEEYTEFYDPNTVACEMGVLPLLQRDTSRNISNWLKDLGVIESNEDLVEEEVWEEQEEEIVIEPEVEEIVYEPHRLEIDTDVLEASANGEKTRWLANYFKTEPCTYANEYTGMFEGYNLIFLTAEAFSTYAIDEELTPTLYRLANSGFVFENYYVPLWQTSTSDGEYINCTGLIPDGQFSMRRSGSNAMPFALPGYFSQEGVTSNAYHNNSLSYYDRYKTHANLGYHFKAARRGSLSKAYQDDIFYMENPKAWPASDLEMMEGTVAEYINLDRFNVYYMTISGHLNYTFAGNHMASKNKDAVSHLNMSENARAYIACNIELDKALEYLLQQLEQAGKLENTVICLGADHYPYGLSDDAYEELAGKSLSSGQDKFRNTLILWNAGMEDEPVYIDKACGPMDIVPTLLNLFGFEYDSRVYAGKDILSDEEGLVIFSDRSFVTDSVIYSKKKNQVIWLTDKYGNDIVPQEQQDAYLEKMKDEVKEKCDFSAYVLKEDYYQDIIEAMQ